MTTPAQNPTAALVGGQTPSNGLTTFEFQSHPLRVIVGEHGEPWFITKDVCAILGYANSNKAIKDHCKIEEVTYRYIPALSNRYRLIDEGNLFLLVTNADKPKAEAFGAWICDVVLTSLRKVEPSQTPTQTPSTGLAPFEFQSHQLRVQTDENGDPWFIAMDVAAILEYSDAYEMTKRLDDDEKQNRQIAGFGPRGVTLISESGLYEAIFGSSKPEARAFKKWVKSEMMPMPGLIFRYWKAFQAGSSSRFLVAMSRQPPLAALGDGLAHQFGGIGRILVVFRFDVFKGFVADTLPVGLRGQCLEFFKAVRLRSRAKHSKPLFLCGWRAAG